MPISIAICDKDSEIAGEIKNLILEEKPTATVEEFFSSEKLLGCRCTFDIYFLDVVGVGGLALAHVLRQRQEERGTKSIIIFVTGYKEHMEEAFDVQAFHYLLKPLHRGKFCEVLGRAWQEAETSKSQLEEFIILGLMGRKEKVMLKDLLFVESAGKRVLVHTDGKVYTVPGKMEDFELVLGSSFFRCHRCYLVNFAKVCAYSPTEIQVEDGSRLLLAHKRYGAFVKAYLDYAQRGGIVLV